MKNVERAHKLHGVLFMGLFSFAAFYMSQLPIFKAFSISPLIIGIVLGMVYANTLRMHLPEEWTPGIKYTSKTILRASIVFFGFRLTLTQIAQVGLNGVLVDAIMVISVLLIGLLLGKLLRVDRNQSILIASGSAICGAAAVLGTEPVLDDKPYKTVVAVSTVVIFGTLAMFLYPAMFRSGMLHAMSEKQIAIYTGATIHEVAHVAGAGAGMGDTLIANLATITKMIRVIMLAPFLLVLGMFITPKNVSASHSNKGSFLSKIQIPWFAVYFLLVIALNSVLMIGADKMQLTADYKEITSIIEWADTFALTMAMTALGCDAEIKKFKEAGLKPFIIALLLFAWLVVGGYFATLWLVH